MLHNLSIKQHVFSLIDLTSLNEADTAEDIIKLTRLSIYRHREAAERLAVAIQEVSGLPRPAKSAGLAMTNAHVAAVCVYPQFVAVVKKELDASIKIAAVANFPSGNEPLEKVLTTIRQSISDGANEIDVVFPYQNYLQNQNGTDAFDFIHQCKLACGKDVLLKVILETGALNQSEIIADVSEKLCLAGADFLKTSTGKTPIGATLEAAEVMLRVIKKISASLHRTIGFKVSGGIRTVEQALQYIELANSIFNPEWVQPNHFRIGASRLVDELHENTSDH